MRMPFETIALTSAVFGNTKLHHVIWKGMLCPPRVYFQSEPTETRKNHMARPQSQRETRRETILTMAAAWGVSRKFGGRIMSAWLPSLAGEG
jgi:hypothetical protein